MEKIAEGKNVTGIPKLGELIGEKTVSAICKWLGIGDEKEIASGNQPEQEEIFHSYEEFENAPPITFSIEGILQNGCATMIGGPSGQGKTLTMLSMVKALLNSHKHKELWHQFKVLETGPRVLYLIPESGITPFKDRLKRFHVYRYVKQGRLLFVHTLARKGRTPDLSDPRILAAAKDAYVFLDPIIRFEEGRESEAADNQRGLATHIFALLNAGARGVVAAHHSPKNFSKETVMTLENMLSGTGDIGAMVGTAFGIKQLNAEKNIIHIENLKARDFEPCGPFQDHRTLPYINDEGDFRMYKEAWGVWIACRRIEGLCNKGVRSARSSGKPKAKRKQLPQRFPGRTTPALPLLLNFQ